MIYSLFICLDFVCIIWNNLHIMNTITKHNQIRNLNSGIKAESFKFQFPGLCYIRRYVVFSVIPYSTYRVSHIPGPIGSYKWYITKNNYQKTKENILEVSLKYIPISWPSVRITASDRCLISLPGLSHILPQVSTCPPSLQHHRKWLE